MYSYNYNLMVNAEVFYSLVEFVLQNVIAQPGFFMQALTKLEVNSMWIITKFKGVCVQRSNIVVNILQEYVDRARS